VLKLVVLYILSEYTLQTSFNFEKIIFNDIFYLADHSPYILSLPKILALNKCLVMGAAIFDRYQFQRFLLYRESTLNNK